jgi:hypothetical protein
VSAFVAAVANPTSAPSAPHDELPRDAQTLDAAPPAVGAMPPSDAQRREHKALVALLKARFGGDDEEDEDDDDGDDE